MLVPAVNVASAHNPFVIGGLREDGSRTRPNVHRWGSEEKVPKDDLESLASESTGRSSKKSSRRHRIRSAFGRSLSPWRYHFDEKKRGGNFNISRVCTRDSLDVEREKKVDSPDDKEEGMESDGESIKGGITPRNNAFGNMDSDDDSEDEMENDRYASDSHRRAKKEREDREQREYEERTEVAGRAKGPSSESDGDGDSQRDGTEDSGEESDDYIDFDEQTLDNTLFNAGCIDLHDAWLKQDGHSHASRTPDEGKTEALGVQEGYYGPNDFDAAWEGAGPTGHDEDDEALRAPNVVVGESTALSPSQLSGEGMDMLKSSHEGTRTDRGFRPRSRSRSPASKGSKSSKSSSAHTGVPREKEQEAKTTSKSQSLIASRPIFERNRCTITLLHGEYDKFAAESKRPKRYIVASDGSEESSYAIEWTIGTVLRDGDEMMVVSVMETDVKLDSLDAKHEDKAARQEYQRIRQSMAVILARRATSVLQRTRLAVKVSCQALHARNSRHMFIDMIDFFEPTMCVVGSRGLNSLKGVLLGSFSNYCVQKSPVPVMVARKRLKLPALPKGKGDVVSNVRARHMRLDEALIEKDANVADEKPQDKEAQGQGDKEEEEKGDQDKEHEDKHDEGKEESRADEESRQQESTEAEKIKEAATARHEDESVADVGAGDEPSGQEEAAPNAGKDDKPSRGRATFSLGATQVDEDRGRSRSRTSDRQSSS